MSKHNVGTVIWLTGLSGAGKTTLAHALLPYLKNTIFLDGDKLREIFGTIQQLGFDTDTRKKLGFSYAKLCEHLAQQGYNILIATICMYHAVHQNNRKTITNYCEIFIDVCEETRKKRDPKGLYKAQEEQNTNNMVNTNSGAELPLFPTILIFEQESLEEATQKVLSFFKKNYPSLI